MSCIEWFWTICSICAGLTSVVVLFGYIHKVCKWIIYKRKQYKNNKENRVMLEFAKILDQKLGSENNPVLSKQIIKNTNISIQYNSKIGDDPLVQDVRTLDRAMKRIREWIRQKQEVLIVRYENNGASQTWMLKRENL